MQEKFAPLDIGPKSVELFKCDGEVISVSDFSKDNLKLLSGPEASFLEKNLVLLNAANDIPIEFQDCLSRSRDLALEPDPVITANRSGARSAYFPEANLQLKGCRPVLKGEGFPTEFLPLGSTKITRGRIPFGVMTAEAVLREILGFCFMQQHGLTIQAIPLAVTAFKHKNKPMGFGMLLRIKSETRVETHLEVPHCTVRELIRIQMSSMPSNTDCVIGSELRLIGINLWKYVETKGRLLASMNWRGGFRGILNSNFGNDVLFAYGDDEHKLALADFDTFSIIPIPDGSSSDPLDSFVLRCLLEVAIGSLPIMQYANLSPESSQEEIADVLGSIYFKKSSLWRSYYRHFLTEANERGIDAEILGASIERMRRTEAFTDILRCRVLSDETINRTILERPYFYSHN